MRRRGVRGALLTALFAWLAAVAMTGRRSATQDPHLPASLQYSLLVRVLGFDRSLPARAGNEIVIAVAFQSGYRASQSAYEELVQAAAMSPDTLVQGRRIRIVPIPLRDAAAAGHALAAEDASVLYIAPLRALGVEEVAGRAREMGIITITGVAEYARRGVAVSLITRGDRPHILVDLRTARAGGADFSAQLLRLVEVIQ